eukprot:338793-Pelagomonas_calceolata.AAC.2
MQNHVQTEHRPDDLRIASISGAYPHPHIHTHTHTEARTTAASGSTSGSSARGRASLARLLTSSKATSNWCWERAIRKGSTLPA